ncbi:acyltransferase family protein [Nocardioides daeguensis]|uniref:Acyltransferase family protein n=1 Tax=Nocardioides daeguensis TaxID=908359 RepID=A0ABP6WKG0_9ACTN|nr:acyltransferase family protein [Nocardioides daeguensis]MBV6729071.1 acyltransferase [Nocardioides daeguensis]MCR1774925.1 acyltransferase [Nocardioides daeguensis]
MTDLATASRTEPAPRPATNRPDGLRYDIQSLRALAVGGVVLYHFWPGALPGGFVGVDVFFVISGYLITSHLLRRPPQHPGDFAAFWARRILRLLPAAGLVIATTLVATLTFLPMSQWKSLAREAVTSIFYVQNWQLISQATDYLDAHRALSPYQHFWSLSVEEQYYIVWPILVALLAWATRRTGARNLVVAGFAVAVTTSFVYSVLLTDSTPAEAYFSTGTRMWELGVGSLLAAGTARWTLRAGPSVRLALMWAGLAGILAAYLVIDGATPFPGYAAALPTVATALVILAGDPDTRLNPRRLTRAWPVQTIGDVSYALYLWHWPIIVIAPYALDHAPSVAQKLVLLLAATALAWASTRLLEEPLRQTRFLRARSRRAIALGAAISLVVVGASWQISSHVDDRVQADQNRVRQQLAQKNPCLGGGAMDPSHGCDSIYGDKLLTSPAFAKNDVTSGIRKCLNWPPYEEKAISCERGSKDDPVAKIALFGNSHAGHWTEALSRIGAKHDWELDTYIVGACFSAIVPQSEECERVTKDATDRILDGDYRMVVFATFDGNDSPPAFYESTLDTFADAGLHVLVVRDTPAPWDQDNEPADCVARNLDDVAACDGTPSEWLRPDPLFEAATARAAEDERITTVDMTRYLCTDKVCPSVIGGIIVFSDYNHLSKTFSRTLAPYLEPAVVAGMKAS